MPLADRAKYGGRTKSERRAQPPGHPDLPKVFCIGFHKTGTTSLKMALMELGYRVTGPFARREHNIAETVEAQAREIAAKYDAFQDNPWPIIYRFLDREYPGSKFILSLRPTQKWIASVVDHFADSQPPMREWIYGPGKGNPVGNEDVYVERYERHNREVLEYFKDRPGDLITFDISAGDGWEKLCTFLGHPVPETPFPWKNSKQIREKRVAKHGSKEQLRKALRARRQGKVGAGA